MVIERTIDGTLHTIELTPRELLRAFREQEHLNDVDDIDCYFACFDDEDMMECFGITCKEAEDMYDDMAYEMRRNIDKYNMSWEYARDDAINTIIKERKGG